jgi:hypothetical protein
MAIKAWHVVFGVGVPAALVWLLMRRREEGESLLDTARTQIDAILQGGEGVGPQAVEAPQRAQPVLRRPFLVFGEPADAGAVPLGQVAFSMTPSPPPAPPPVKTPVATPTAVSGI